MNRCFNSLKFTFSHTFLPKTSLFAEIGNFRPSFGFARFSLLASFMYTSSKLYCLPSQDHSNPQKPIVTTVDPRLVQNPKTLWQKVKSWITHTLRLLQLILIFIPPLLCFPLKLFKSSQKLWLKLFVGSVERAGVVWIKAFQYLSHRRDVIGASMAESFTHLRENAPQHSFQQTRKTFKNSYGLQINQIFDEFEETPIASGSVSQVYKAVYKGKKVAVKVRHPQVDKYIQRDVNIMFGISRFLSLFSKSYEIPVGQNSLKRTLIEQIDFNIEKDNLNIFNKHFHGNQLINFPQAFDKLTCDSILIETFVEGLPVMHYEQNRHPLNAVIARLGATCFFQMLMKHNFIHADCHGGNILVEVTKQPFSFSSEVKAYLCEKLHQLEQKWDLYFLQSPTLRKLYTSSRAEQRRIRDLVRKCTQQVKINVIDVGMVIQLNELDRSNFINFIKSIIEGNGQTCANMIFKLSNFQGKKIVEGKYQDYMTQLRNLFSVLDNKSIFDVEGINLLIGMLDIIRNHNMKLDGEFATLLTNMVVLESIAKEIDPEIQILKCAIPYFKFVDGPTRNKQNAKTLNSLLV